MRGRYPWWGDGAEGTAPTSSGSVAEGVSSRAPPWIPHRGAVRRLGGGYRIGVRHDDDFPRLTGEKTACPVLDTGVTPHYDAGPVSMVGWRCEGYAPTSSGSVAEGVSSRAPPWIPHRGAVRRGSGWVTHRGAARRRQPSSYRRKNSLRPCLTRGHPALRCGAGIHGGVAVRRVRTYFERVCSRRGLLPGPTMDTASGCGTTTTSLVLPAQEQPAPCLTRGHPALRCGAGIHGGVAVRRVRANLERVCRRRGLLPGPTMDTASGCGKTVGGVGTASGYGTTTTALVLPVKKQPAPCLTRGHPALRCGAGIHGGVTAVGTALTSSGFCSRRGLLPGPTMDTASGCGKTVGGVDTASGCGTTTTSLVLPAQEQPAPCLTRGHPAPRSMSQKSRGYTTSSPVGRGLR